MGMLNTLVFVVVFAMVFACGEVSGNGDGHSHSTAERPSSSSKGNASSSSSFSIDLIWQTPNGYSYIGGDFIVTVTFDPFEVSRFLITQGQYKAVMGTNPSLGIKGDNLPVDGADWFKAVEFCEKLSTKMGLGPGAIRLPTEAEWEYVAYPGSIVINREQDYWEWTNDCFDSQYPYASKNPSGPPNCPVAAPISIKGLNKEFNYRTWESPYSVYRNSIDRISFRVVRIK